MNISVVIGGSQEDERALHFTYCTLLGLGCEKHIALYFPSTNVLEVHPECAKLLPRILKSLRTYMNNRNIGSERNPITVKYWL